MFGLKLLWLKDQNFLLPQYNAHPTIKSKSCFVVETHSAIDVRDLNS